MPNKKNKKNPQRSKILHFFFQVLAIILLIAGIIMLVTPGPGWAAIIIAVILLGKENKLGRWIISKLPHRVQEEIRKRQRK